MSRPVAISLRLYRALARAFPYEFKNAYEEELVQVTEDAIEPLWRRHGVLGLLRLVGRGFRKEDEANGARAIVVTEKLVREFWNGEDPLGRRIEIGNSEIARFDLFLGSALNYRYGVLGKGRQVFEVVGVAKDVKMESALERARPAIYFPLHPVDYAQPSFQGMTLMVRAAPGVDAIRAVRREIQAMDANVQPFNPRSMLEQIDRVMIAIYVSFWSYGAMGLFGLILAAVGVAGVTAYSVTQRRHELGIRIALGARGSDVLALVMKEGLLLVTAGATIGLAGAWAITRVLSATLEPVAKAASRSTSNPVILVGAPLPLGALALAACYVPARKSMRVDPVVALRQE